MTYVAVRAMIEDEIKGGIPSKRIIIGLSLCLSIHVSSCRLT